MIKTFAHKALERYYFHSDKRGLNARHVPRIERILDRLNAALSVADMNLPGYGLHRLSGNRQDTYSVKVSGNWRITFRFEEGSAFDVNLEDYH